MLEKKDRGKIFLETNEFNYSGLNKVKATLNGVNVSKAIAELLMALHSLGDYGEAFVGYDKEQDLITVEGCESFGFGDFACVVEDVVSLPISYYDELKGLYVG